jgi:sirohydrochlorin cobaltochelatase
MGFGWAEVSYSDAAYPLFDACMAKGIKLGFKRIIVFPYFLFTGTLVRRIYTWADKCQAAHPEIEIINASYLTDHEQLLDCFVDRIREALDGDNNMNCLFCKYREQIVGDELDQGELQAGHDHAAGIGIDGHGAAYDGVHGYGHSHEHPHGHSHKQGKSDAS